LGIDKDQFLLIETLFARLTNKGQIDGLKATVVDQNRIHGN
jgi:hypothetical protein